MASDLYISAFQVTYISVEVYVPMVQCNLTYLEYATQCSLNRPPQPHHHPNTALPDRSVLFSMCKTRLWAVFSWKKRQIVAIFGG